MTDAVTDEMLTAYLDGELPDAEHAAISRELETDPHLAARLEELDVSKDDLRAAFDATLDQAPAMPALPEPARQRGGLGAMGLGAAVAAGIAIGAIWSPNAPEPGKLAWKMAVANYQALYVPETLWSYGRPDPSRLKTLSKDLGRDLTAAAEVENLKYRRAQMLGLDGAPLVQIAYLADGNVPVAICITKVDQDAYAPQTETLLGLASAHWVEDGYGYLVIGGEDMSLVEGVATELRGRI